MFKSRQIKRARKSSMSPRRWKSSMGWLGLFAVGYALGKWIDHKYLEG